MTTNPTFKSININGTLLSLEEPRIMGILNITPDSFYEQSRTESENDILKKAEEMLEAGADILDIGGYSSRPGATDIDPDEELHRILPAITAVCKHFPKAVLSIDTFRASVAERAVEAGATMINDISGGNLDSSMFETVARLNVPYILMHMRGTPQSMTKETSYNNLLADINSFLAIALSKLTELGVADVIIDPGIGFAKTIDQNFELLRDLNAFQVHSRPLMVGLSRKSMIWKTLHTSPDHALNGTTALHMTALMNGANILRVHDVKEAVEVVTLFNHMQKV